MVLVVVLIALVTLGRWQTNEYALTPGDATPVAPLVKIHGVATNPHVDTIMLTDVYLTRLTVWQWVTMHLQSHVQFVSAGQLLEPGNSERRARRAGLSRDE